MAIGAIEFLTIARSQDYTAIKQNEDNRGVAQQNNLVHNMQHEVEQKTKQVNQSDNAGWQEKKFDAKDKGNGNYSGDGGNNRKKQNQPDGKVLLKGQGSFDIKI
ncbi:MAG TPA: hypothetical protein VJY54_14070 [Lachnospiraceae bacterium]|nr:hypothetical protein [Lachnospiraceae bacterium]